MRDRLLRFARNDGSALAAMLLRRLRRSPGIEPVAPQFARRRLRHAEKRRRQFDGKMGCGRRHDGFSTMLVLGPEPAPYLRTSGFNVKAKQA